MRILDYIRSQRPGILTQIGQYEFVYLTILSHLKNIIKNK